MTNSNTGRPALSTTQLARYSFLRSQGHGALRAYRAARRTIGASTR